MKILDPISGETVDTDTWDQTNLSILPERHMMAAQRRMWPDPNELLTDQNALGRMIQSDPGDEA